MEPSAGPLEEVRAQRARLRGSLVELENALSLAAGRPAYWASAVGERLDGYLDALERHTTTAEGETGLFAQVLDHAPRLAPKIDRLRTEHDEMRGTAVDLRDRCGTELDPEGIEEIREAALEIVRATARHRQRGADLLYEAYEVDIAASD